MIVLDTNVLSEEMKPTPERAVHNWLMLQSPPDLFTTAVTEAEITTA
jgi:toxin FitB